MKDAKKQDDDSEESFPVESEEKRWNGDVYTWILGLHVLTCRSLHLHSNIPSRRRFAEQYAFSMLSII